MQTNQTPREANLSIMKDVEAGDRVVDGQYYKALEETNDIVQFSPKLIAILKIARIVYREQYNINAVKITGTILTLNRELITEYSKDSQGNDELWKDDLSIVVLLSMCHFFRGFNEKYLQDHLSASSLFDKKEITRIVKLIFGSGWNQIIIKRRTNDLLGWKKRVLKFLEHLPSMPTPSILVFLAHELKALRLINQGLKDKGGEAWSIVNLPKQEQLWYFSRIVDHVKSSSNRHVAKILDEYRSVSMEIFEWLKNNKEAPVAAEG